MAGTSKLFTILPYVFKDNVPFNSINKLCVIVDVPCTDSVWEKQNLLSSKFTMREVSSYPKCFIFCFINLVPNFC